MQTEINGETVNKYPNKYQYTTAGGKKFPARLKVWSKLQLRTNTFPKLKNLEGGFRTNFTLCEPPADLVSENE